MTSGAGWMEEGGLRRGDGRVRRAGQTIGDEAVVRRTAGEDEAEA